MAAGFQDPNKIGLHSLPLFSFLPSILPKILRNRYCSECVVLCGTALPSVSALRSRLRKSLDQLFASGNSGTSSVSGIAGIGSATWTVLQPGKQTITLSAQSIVLRRRRVDRVHRFRQFFSIAFLHFFNSRRLGRLIDGRTALIVRRSQPRARSKRRNDAH